jgi:hypothetical protein
MHEYLAIIKQRFNEIAIYSFIVDIEYCYWVVDG